MTDLAVVVLTRPAPRSRAFAAALEDCARPLRVVVAPLVEIRCLDADIPAVFGDVVLTSQSAVDCLPAAVSPKGHRAWCVGDRTAEAARHAGFDAVSAGGDADALVRLLLRADPARPLLHLRGEQARGAVAARLSEAGLPAQDRIVYRQQDRAPTVALAELLGSDRSVVAPVFSPRASRRLAEVAREARAKLRVVAISAAAAEVWAGREAEVIVAEAPTGAAMLHATLQAAGALPPC